MTTPYNIPMFMLIRYRENNAQDNSFHMRLGSTKNT